MKKILLLLPIFVLAGCGVTTQGGQHTGYISAVEKNGLFWPTATVYVKTDLSSSQENYYCVENEDVLNQLRAKSENKEKVTLLFHDEMWVAPWRCNGEEGIVDGIK